MLRINAGGRPAVAALDHAELRHLLAVGGLHLVAVAVDRTIVGYALTFAAGDPYDGEEFRHFTTRIRQRFIYVDQLAIDRERQREGIGSKLYAALIAHAGVLGIAVLCCEVNTEPPNPGSMNFHRRLGFTAIGARSTLDGREVALLVKTL